MKRERDWPVFVGFGVLAVGALILVSDYFNRTAPPPHICEDALRIPTPSPTATLPFLPDVRIAQRWQGIYVCRDAYAPYQPLVEYGTIVLEGTERLPNPCPYRVRGVWKLAQCSSTSMQYFPTSTPRPPFPTPLVR